MITSEQCFPSSACIPRCILQNSKCNSFKLIPPTSMKLHTSINCSKEVTTHPSKKGEEYTRQLKETSKIKWCASILVCKIRFHYFTPADIPFYISNLKLLYHTPSFLSLISWYGKSKAQYTPTAIILPLRQFTALGNFIAE